MRHQGLPQRPSACHYGLVQEVYVRSVRDRALAIYRVGRPRDPGWADLSLLVVPRRPRVDNGAFFSVRHALPARLRSPFRSDPKVVPPTCLPVLRYTTCGDRTLLFGEDVAAGIAPDESDEQRWSLVFERLCQFDRLARELEASGIADVSRLISKAESLGDSLRTLDALTGSRQADDYTAAVERLRDAHVGLDPGEAAAQIERSWRHGMALLLESLEKRLPLAPGQSAVDFGRAFLLGEARIQGLCEEDLAARRAAVAVAQASTRAYGFKKGDVFPRTPYRSRIDDLDRALLPPAPVRVAIDGVYRVRRWLYDQGLLVGSA
jgi:hypothetical protein